MMTLSISPATCPGGAIYPCFNPRNLQSLFTITHFSKSHLVHTRKQISNKTRCRSNSNSSSDKSKIAGEENELKKPTAAFFDEEGAVKDMDGYLNYLSLEYDSVWDTKPSWCQPWTITLTGVLLITCSWLVLHSVIVTSLVSILISAWWYIFLYSYPQEYAKMIEERRKNVTSGLEDTYGSRNPLL